MKNGQFHNTLTVRNLPQVFMGSTIDQGSKAILGTSSQQNKILTDCSADYTDKIGYDYQYRGVLPRKDSYAQPQ